MGYGANSIIEVFDFFFLLKLTVRDKILEGENFGELGKFYPIRQNFLVQLKN